MSSQPVALTPAARRAGRLIAATALCVYVATAGGSLATTDAVFTYEITKSLVTEGSVAASYNVKGAEAHRGVDGRYYSPFGIGQSIFNIPFFIAGQAVRRSLGLTFASPEMLDKAAVALGSTVASAAAVWVVFLFAWRLSGHLMAAGSTALLFAFATMMWPYAKLGFNAPLATWCLVAGVYTAWVGIREGRQALVAWAGVWLACTFLTRHEMGLAVPVVAALIALQGPDWRTALGRLTRLGVPVAAAVAFWLWYNHLRFGDPLNSGYRNDVTVAYDPTWTGFYGLLFSPGGSIFLYTPLTIAGIAGLPRLWRFDRSLAILFAGLCLVFLIFFGSLNSWEGGRSYGPRYLVPLLPFLVLPITWWLRPDAGIARRAVLAVGAVSLLVQIPGVLVDFSKVGLDYARQHDAGLHTRLYGWKGSSLVVDTRAAWSAVPTSLGHLIRGDRPAVIAAAPADQPDTLSQALSFSLDFWWVYLYFLGALPAPASLLIGVGLFGVAAALGRRALLALSG